MVLWESEARGRGKGSGGGEGGDRGKGRGLGGSNGKGRGSEARPTLGHKQSNFFQIFIVRNSFKRLKKFQVPFLIDPVTGSGANWPV